jgi:murein DD-endopeptidase MepM/ murein hydrolase activator NlpD
MTSRFSLHAIGVVAACVLCSSTLYAQNEEASNSSTSDNPGTEVTRIEPTAEELEAIRKQQVIDSLKSKIGSQSSEIKNLEKEIADVRAKLNSTLGQKDSLRKALATLELNKTLIEKDLSITQKKIELSNASIAELDTSITAARIKIDQGKSALAKSLRAIEQGEEEGLGSGLSKLVSAGSLSEMLDVAARIRDFQEAILYQVDVISEEKKKLEETQAEHANQLTSLVYLQLDLVDKQKVVESNKKEKTYLLNSTKNQEATYQKQLAERKAKIAKLQAELNAYEEQLRVEIDPATLPATGSGVLKWPLAKHTITQYFGNTAFASKNAQVYSGKGHNGIDIAASVGTPVQASLTGTVIDTGDTDVACPGSSYGKYVLIKHNNGLTTLYAHLSVIRTTVGASVVTGQVIGLSGNTGYSTGPHLHFTVFASKAVTVINRKSAACGTIMKIPVSPQNGYLNPLSYLLK